MGPAASSSDRPGALVPSPIVTWRAVPLVLVPAAALALGVGSFLALDYVHVPAGGLWTGVDLFMGLVLGPIMGRMTGPARAELVQRLVPTMLFLMPALASVTITAGVYLAVHEGIFDLGYLAIRVAGVLVLLRVAQGLGIFLPNEVRVVLELRRAPPDLGKVGRLGLMNARLAGLQAAFQVALLFVRANLAASQCSLGPGRSGSGPPDRRAQRPRARRGARTVSIHVIGGGVQSFCQ